MAEAAAARWSLRPYAADDEAAATWQHAYPQIDFSARLDWWRKRWRDELVATARVTVAERGGALIGFVTVDPATGYLDQIVVDPQAWGSGVAAALVAEAKRLAPAGVELFVNQDNARAIRFYGKHGFAVAGTDVNSRSGAPIYRMRWQPS
jgi:putative acetyltransferase